MAKIDTTPDDAPDLSDFELPATLKAAHKLLVELHDSQPATADEGRVKSAKLSKLAAHIYTLEQGSPAPVMNSGHFQTIAKSQTDRAEALLLDELMKRYPQVKVLIEKCASLEKQIEQLKPKK